MTICPFCKEKIPEEAKICPICNETLNTTRKLTCPYCKEEMEEGSGVCPVCRESLQTKNFNLNIKLSKNLKKIFLDCGINISNTFWHYTNRTKI